MQQIFSNTTLTVNQLIEKIDTGELGLPELQRPFIWKDSKVRDLFDSMMCGYPIGYLMLWECPTLEKKKTIGTDTHNYEGLLSMCTEYIGTVEAYETLHMKNYDKFHFGTVDIERRFELREKQFPLDLEKAYELGKKVCL